MQKISIVMDGQMQAVPVLTPKHLSLIHKIQVGKNSSHAPDILRDLIDAGLVTEQAEDSLHGTRPMA